MTFSIAARCSRTGQLGVAAITAMMGVGKLVSYAQAGVGAVASQATMNPYLGFDGLRAMEGGLDAESALEKVMSADPGRDHRQCGMVDAHGGAAAWSGPENADWTGHVTGEGLSVQGNRLVGSETLDAVVTAYEAHAERDLAERFLLALEAGEATGADRKGAVSGVIVVVDTEEYPLWEVRVDQADDPAARLRELYHRMAEDLIPQVRQLPTRADPLGEMTRRQMRGATAPRGTTDHDPT